MDPLKDSKGENWHTPFHRKKPKKPTRTPQESGEGPTPPEQSGSELAGATNTRPESARVQFHAQTNARPGVQTRSSTRRENEQEEPMPEPAVPEPAAPEPTAPEPDTTLGAPESAFMPYWGRSTYATHKDSRKDPVPGKKKAGSASPAGYPDFLYFLSASFGDYGCLGEVKTPWAINDDTIQVMYEQAQDFTWKEKSIQCEVWRQVSLL